MSRQFRNRLTGGLAFLALLAVFVPALFDGEGLTPAQPVPAIYLDLKDDFKTESSPIDSSAEQWEFWQVAEELRDKISASRLTNDYLQAEGGTVGQSTSESDLAGTAFDSQGIPVAWAVQVAAFSGREEAVRLKEQLDGHAYLQEGGHTAYLSHGPSEEDARVLYRVAIGPFLDRREAVMVQSVLAHEAIAPKALIRNFRMLDKQ